MDFQPIIGLEIHVQLATTTKLFCGCRVEFGATPNSLTCPVCLGLPGALPVVNRRAVELGVRLAMALECQVQTTSIFARKHYFYPDLPKGYQITQYDAPLAVHGSLAVNRGSEAPRRIRIERVHLEEDAGRLIHDEDYVPPHESLVDLNRCGTPLAEIVTAPVIRSPQEAKQTVAALQQLVRWLAVSDGNMAEGSLRCDANISLQTTVSETGGVKTEIKNINSLRGVERALTAEIDRQTDIIKKGKRIQPATLLWDEGKERIVPMRSKEEADDYRYFPEPDLPPLSLSNEWVKNIEAKLPETPAMRRLRYVRDMSLSYEDAEVLLRDRDLSDFFEETLEHGVDPNQTTQWIKGELLQVLNAKKWSIHELKMKPRQMAEIIHLFQDGEVNRATAARVIETVSVTGAEPSKVIDEKGWRQVSDISQILEKVNELMKRYPDEVKAYQDGEEKLFRFFMGQVMAALKGKGDPHMIAKVLKDQLETR